MTSLAETHLLTLVDPYLKDLLNNTLRSHNNRCQFKQKFHRLCSRNILLKVRDFRTDINKTETQND